MLSDSFPANYLRDFTDPLVHNTGFIQFKPINGQINPTIGRLLANQSAHLLGGCRSLRAGFVMLGLLRRNRSHTNLTHSPKTTAIRDATRAILQPKTPSKNAL